MSANLITRYLEGQKNDKSFDTFYDKILIDSEEFTAQKYSQDKDDHQQDSKV